MVDQDCIMNIEKQFSELLTPSYSPEVFLQILSTSPSTLAYKTEDTGSFAKFCVFMKYIMAKLPDGPVDGIWEEIISKTIMYSQNPPKFCTNLLAPIKNQIYKWLFTILSFHGKCPNTYLRLKIFRLVRILKETFRYEMHPIWEPLCETFMFTICEIHPLHMYLSGDIDKMLFGVQDFDYITRKIKIKNITRDLSDNDVYIHSSTAQFISYSLQLVGIFAHMYFTMYELNFCYRILSTFSHIASRPQFHSCIVETFRELTAASFNLTGNNRDHTVWLLKNREFALTTSYTFGVVTKSSDLPGLLLSRQIQGPRAVRQHALLLDHLSQSYFDKTASSEEEDSSDSDSSGDESIEGYYRRRDDIGLKIMTSIAKLWCFRN